MRPSRSTMCSAAGLLLGLAGSAAGQTCYPRWSPQFFAGTTSNVTFGAIAYDDDGPGPHLPALYIAYENQWAQFLISKWNGTAFTTLPSTPGDPPLQSAPIALCIFDDDGPGPHPPALYLAAVLPTPPNYVGAGALFKWDGAAWTTVIPPQYANYFQAMAASDGQSLPRGLYLGCEFLHVGSIGATFNVRFWDGSTVTTLPGEFDSYIRAMRIVDDDGPGPRPPSLVIGGLFPGIYRWDGSAWATLGSLAPSGSACLALESFDIDGPGPAPSALYAAGVFTSVDGVAAQDIARWDGAAWHSAGFSTPSGGIQILKTFTDAAGPALYASGTFSQINGLPINHIARYSSQGWSGLGSGPADRDATPTAMEVFDDDGPGPRPPYLAVTGLGAFTNPNVGGVPAFGLARWDGTQWFPYGNAPSAAVRALQVFDDGHGPALYAAGEFAIAGGLPVNHIARWNGASWESLARGLNDAVSALAVFDDGSGPALYAGGDFLTADNGSGPIPALHIARWNGAQWSPVGPGLDGAVTSLLAYNDGSGPRLYAGGAFLHAGALNASHIARWNGAAWSPAGDADGSVDALCIANLGPGPRLYAGGQFLHIGGTSAPFIASWDGTAWSGLAGGTNNRVHTLAFFDGGGPSLYAGGRFTTAGGSTALGIARWNGSAWSPLGPGLDNHVDTLAVFDNGSGASLYAGGKFLHPANILNVTVDGLARWDGTAWQPVDQMGSGPLAMTVFDPDGPGPASPSLMIGGRSFYAGQDLSPFFAQWQGCAPSCYANCDQSTTPPVLNINDFVCFLDRFASGNQYANCDQSTTPPTLNVLDFVCFLNRFASGCP